MERQFSFQIFRQKCHFQIRLVILRNLRESLNFSGIGTDLSSPIFYLEPVATCKILTVCFQGFFQLFRQIVASVFSFQHFLEQVTCEEYSQIMMYPSTVSVKSVLWNISSLWTWSRIKI
ncbi:hypothetical protein HHI36_015970 [Cryptolaemus montrouzieri]|uniref:Uncharacterized protein n=1 Tax=Cryptolaemus montrouzieri TaxID=559131 RepID=A0ABD2N7W1_9CUCU